MTEWQDIQKDPDFVESGVRKLLSDFQDQPNIANTLRTLLAEGKATDDGIVDVIDMRSIANATGTHLDRLGALVGESRLGRDDPTYRNGIRLRVRANVSQGRISDLFVLLALALGALPRSFMEIPYGNYVVQVRDLPTSLQQPFADMLSRVRPLGHQGELVYTPLPAARTLRFANAGAPGVRFYNAGQAGSSNRPAHARRL